MRERRLHIAAICLAALMLLKMLGMPIVSLSFEMNRQAIAAKFCENRLKPQLHCNGQCILMKKLAKANESTESKDFKGFQKTISIDYFQEINATAFIRPSFLSTKVNEGLQPSLKSPNLPAIFHPPLFVS